MSSLPATDRMLVSAGGGIRSSWSRNSEPARICCAERAQRARSHHHSLKHGTPRCGVPSVTTRRMQRP